METRKTQKEFRAIESLLLNTKTLCDSLLNDEPKLDLVLCEIKQERISIEQGNIDSMDDKEFIRFVEKDIEKLFKAEQDQLLDILKWLEVLESAENYLSNNEEDNDETVVTFCKNEIDELNTLADEFSASVRRLNHKLCPYQNEIDTFFYRKRRVQGILNVLSVSKTLSNDYLVDFPNKNPEFKRTIDMIVSLFTYSQIFSENFLNKTNERLRRIDAEGRLESVRKTLAERVPAE